MSGTNGGRPDILIAPMTVADISQVVEIDRLSFPLPWSANSYRYELTQNRAAHFRVAVDPTSEPKRGLFDWFSGQRPTRLVIGYGGFWRVVDEVHIGTIAVHPRWRGQGIGEQLLVSLLQQAIGLGAVEAKLEVRMSNQVAQNLYRKYRFEEVGRRKHYYRDNHEDALLMTARLEGPLRDLILRTQQRVPSQETV
jgi:ribosomal-protein-alanine N-acetyltransferase